MTSGGFTAAVTLSVSGLPGGVTSSFNPSMRTAFSTIAEGCAAATPPGSYALTITGASGTLTRTTSVTLAVNPAPVPDFILSATPASQSVVQGAGTTYTERMTPRGGSTPAVTSNAVCFLSGETASFSPNPATASSTM